MLFKHGKPDWCGVSQDGQICICMRVEDGAYRTTDNGGYLHKLDASQISDRPWREAALHRKPEPVDTTNWPILAQTFQGHVNEEPCIIWTMIIGESGTHKTPAMKRSLSSIQAQQMIEMDRYDQAFELHDAELAEYEKHFKAWKRSKNSECPSKPVAPTMKRLLCQDITVEALAAILANNDRGVLVARDELSGWLSSFDAYKKQGSADVAQWLEMYNGGTLTVDRKTGDQRTLYVPRASVSVTGGIQPGVLTSLFGDKHFENGLAARFLVAMPPRKPKRWTDAILSDDDQAVMDRIFAGLWSLSFNEEKKPIACCFDFSGKQVFKQFYDEHADEQNQLNGKYAAAWSKLEAYTARFALLIQLLRTVENGTVQPQASTMIDGESVTVRDAMRNGPCYRDKATVK